MKLKKAYTIGEISKIYNCKIKGDPNTVFDSVSSLANSKKKSINVLATIKRDNYSDRNIAQIIVNDAINS